jgi:hypothetical protein
MDTALSCDGPLLFLAFILCRALRGYCKKLLTAEAEAVVAVSL